jgi:hypothetical protein
VHAKTAPRGGHGSPERIQEMREAVLSARLAAAESAHSAALEEAHRREVELRAQLARMEERVQSLTGGAGVAE